MQSQAKEDDPEPAFFFTLPWTVHYDKLKGLSPHRHKYFVSQ